MGKSRIVKADPKIEGLATSVDRKDREKAAKSLKCLPETLIKLAKDQASVKSVAIQNPNFPLSEMKRLAIDKTPDYETLEALLKNPSISTEILRALAKRERKRHSLDSWDSWDSWDPSMLSHPNCPREFIKKLLAATVTESEGYGIYEAIARNSALTEPEIKLLFMRKEKEVDLYLVRNRKISQSNLHLIFNRYKSEKKIDARILRALILRLSSPHLKQEAIELLIKSSQHHKNREFVAAYTSEVEHAKAACLDENKAVRRRAKRNKITPKTSKVIATLLDGL